jgi:peptidoglycan/LPS O-acetylase OafA/YrhL
VQTVFDHNKNNFDFLRLALSTLVIFSHSYPLATGSESAEPFNMVTRNQVTGGHIAVDAFFIISGFLITASFDRSKNLGDYLKKRIFRIYPAFVVAMLFELFVVLPASGGHMVAMTSLSRTCDFVVQTIRLQEFHYDGAFAGNPAVGGAMNGSVWSIQYEFWCYIGVALLGVTGLLRSNRWLISIFVSSVVISILFAVFKWTRGGSFLGIIFGYPLFWARLLPMYMAGVVFYRVRNFLSLRTSWIAVACASLVVAAVVPYGWTVVFPVAGTFILLTLAFHPTINLSGWSRYGDFSYGTYLYAFPVAQLIMHIIGHPVMPWVLFSLALPLSLIFAFVSWYMVERWFLMKPSRSMHETIEAPKNS